MTEGKQALIQGLSSEYDIGTADDIQDALKDLLAGTIQGMLECEMDDHLVYDKYERSSEPDHCDGQSLKLCGADMEDPKWMCHRIETALLNLRLFQNARKTSPELRIK